MTRTFLFSALLALLILQGCGESTDDLNRAAQTVTKIGLMKDTMVGNEAEASNGLMTRFA